MPVLTELDLNAPIEDYCLTITRRFKKEGSTFGRNHPSIGTNFGFDSTVLLPPHIINLFQEKMKVVSSQKERFSPHLFKIIEKTHFENLLPFSESCVSMPRQEATDIFIEYAEEFHRLGETTERIETKIQELKEDIYFQVDTTYAEFMRALDEVKEYGTETRHLLYNQKKFIQKEFDEAVEDTLDGMEDYIRKYDNRFTYIDKVFSDSMYSTMEINTKCNNLAQDMNELRHELKDIQVLTTKRINQLETKIARQISNTIITNFILLGLFFVIQFVLSVNPVTKTPGAFPLLPGA
jgi:hypothetical protein